MGPRSRVYQTSAVAFHLDRVSLLGPQGREQGMAARWWNPGVSLARRGVSMAAYDVIVLGCGGMVSAAAYHLAQRGAYVLALEQFGVAHDQGSSHGRNRVIRQAYYEGPDYVPLLFRAYDLWHALEREAGTTLLTKTGAIHMGASDSAAVAGAALSARTHRIPHEMLTADELRKRYPVLRPRPQQVALFEYEAGTPVPDRFTAPYTEGANGGGAALHFQERADSWAAPPPR